MWRRWHITASALMAAGLIAMVAGTFAPWLQSGQVRRNSYRTAGLLQRLLGPRGPAGDLLNAIPLLAVLCALVSVIYIAGWHRTGATLLAMLALGIGTLSVLVLSAPSARGVRVVADGPVITLTGSLITIAAAVALVASPRADLEQRR